uniref:C2H2-type domain-containing protein n=1 Tax=Globodera rostochiensis TaxID=31243 RepID=A0A914GVZ4_GLORO
MDVDLTNDISLSEFDLSERRNSSPNNALKNGESDDVLIVNQHDHDDDAKKNGTGKASVDCILLDDDEEEEDDNKLNNNKHDDDDDEEQEEEQQQQPVNRSPVPEDPKTSKELTTTPAPTCTDSTGGESSSNKPATGPSQEINSYSDLLDRLELYVRTAIDESDTVDRKVLDALLSAINTQVQKAPYAVRKLILDKQLVLPNTISVPPSQIVELLIEHDPDHQLSRVINRLFGEERPKLSDHEKKEKQLLKAMHPAPNMTKLLLEIGQDLVQESTYFDIVHARNLPEMPKNMDTYKQVAAQLKPVWEGLRAKNEPFKLKLSTCHACNFKTDSRTVLDGHLQTLHFIGRRFQCTFCPEFDTNEYRITKHIIEEHGVRPTSAETFSTKMQCPICEVEFNYKGQRDSHLRSCRRDLHKLRTIQSGHSPEHILVVNRWLWEKPPMEPSILIQQQQQQEAALRQQQQFKQQQQQLLRNQRLIGSAAANSLTSHARFIGGALSNRFPGSASQAHSQQVGPSVGQILRMARDKGQTITPQMIQAAMQTQLLQQQQKLKSHQILAAAAAKLPPQQHQQPQQSATTVMNNSSQRAVVGQQQNTRQLLKASASSVHPSAAATTTAVASPNHVCEICDFAQLADREQYRVHLQNAHRQLLGKNNAEMASGAPLACSRCRDRFWTYEGLERHLVMVHGLVTADLLAKAQRKADSGRCKLCSKQYAFNILQHLVSDHQIKLCSAEIMYSCDVCSYRCTSYQKLERHLEVEHPTTNKQR